jgi:hypothetical protein
MIRRRRRPFALVALWSAALALLSADLAAADPVPAWSGTKGAFAWEARRIGCGIVGRSPSVVRAHTRWRTSPANGYVRLTFTRQLQDAGTGSWATVQRLRRTTRNTPLEGARGVLHWSQWFFPFADDAGETSRHIVAFEWFRDLPGPGPDPRVLRRERVLGACVVGPA